MKTSAQSTDAWNTADPIRRSLRHRGALIAMAFFAACTCGRAADREMIGAECTQTAECENELLTCLTQFSGGYCGKAGCAGDVDCPPGSRCVNHLGTNFCFLECLDKPECNVNRSVANEANCSSSITRVDSGGWKACVPPSSGL